MTKNSLKVSETFVGLQGEGRYCGMPMLFIRLSGCTRHCPWCDSKYHVDGKYISIDALVKTILKSNMTVCITGGEPLLQAEMVHRLVWAVRNKHSFAQFHLETNGDKLTLMDFDIFDYIAISPKNPLVAKRVNTFRVGNRVVRSDVKVVTDLHKVGLSMIKHASMLMPLTVENEVFNHMIRRRVWEFCIKEKINYSPRLHIEVFGRNKRGV